MTHDELLAKIDYYLVPTNKLFGDEGVKNSAIGFMQALRAVVKLHTETEDGYCAWCYLCNYDRTGLYMDSAMYAYPCPTIQAIEKELG